MIHGYRPLHGLSHPPLGRIVGMGNSGLAQILIAIFILGPLFILLLVAMVCVQVTAITTVLVKRRISLAGLVALTAAEVIGTGALVFVGLKIYWLLP
jgi:hypothetical protein